MILLSHPTGNANLRHALQALSEAQLLAEFWTCIAWDENSLASRVLPQGLKEQFARRTFDVADSQLIHTMPWRETARLLAPKLRLQSLAKHETGMCSVDAVYRALDAKVAKRLSRVPNLKAVYAYEDGACTTFQQAQLLGLKRIYDLPIAYWETGTRLMKEESERWPEWAPTLEGTRNSEEKLQRKTDELKLADTVIVPSQFVYDSLPEQIRAGKSCHITEFGSPNVTFVSSTRNESGNASKPLRVLFAGSMTQRKGLADLFAAMKLLQRRDVELIVMGSPLCPLDWYRQQYAEFTYEAPRPHSMVLELMRSCDVFVLPSIVEGRALVQQEAMSCGLPLIVTANAGGQDLIVEGETGFLIPIRAPEKIAEKIEWLASNRAHVMEMKNAATQKAALYTWQTYRSKIVAAVISTFKKS